MTLKLSVYLLPTAFLPSFLIPLFLLPFLLNLPPPSHSLLPPSSPSSSLPLDLTHSLHPSHLSSIPPSLPPPLPPLHPYDLAPLVASIAGTFLFSPSFSSSAAPAAPPWIKAARCSVTPLQHLQLRLPRVQWQWRRPGRKPLTV